MTLTQELSCLPPDLLQPGFQGLAATVLQAANWGNLTFVGHPQRKLSSAADGLYEVDVASQGGYRVKRLGEELHDVKRLLLGTDQEEAEAELLRRSQLAPVTDVCHPCYANCWVKGDTSDTHRMLLPGPDLTRSNLLVGVYFGEIRTHEEDARYTAADVTGARGMEHSYNMTISFCPELVVVGNHRCCRMTLINDMRSWSRSGEEDVQGGAAGSSNNHSSGANGRGVKRKAGSGMDDRPASRCSLRRGGAVQGASRSPGGAQAAVGQEGGSRPLCAEGQDMSYTCTRQPCSCSRYRGRAANVTTRELLLKQGASLVPLLVVVSAEAWDGPQRPSELLSDWGDSFFPTIHDNYRQWRAYTDLQRGLSSAQQQVTALQAQLQQLQRAQGGLQAQQAGLQAQLQRAQGERDQARQECTGLRQQLQQTQREGQQGGQQVAALQRQVAEQGAELQRMQAGCSSAARVFSELMVVADEAATGGSAAQQSPSNVARKLDRLQRILQGLVGGGSGGDAAPAPRDTQCVIDLTELDE